MKYTSRADLLIAAGESIKMQEKAGIEPVFKLHDGPCGNDVRVIRTWRPAYDSNPKDYEFPLAVVEGKPVFDGDELYSNSTGQKFKAYFGAWLSGNPDISWNPPKPKTVMVELLREDAEWFVARAIADYWTEKASIRTADACRKALEKA